jgi:hypothetical protein
MYTECTRTSFSIINTDFFLQIDLKEYALAAHNGVALRAKESVGFKDEYARRVYQKINKYCRRLDGPVYNLTPKFKRMRLA